VLILAHSTTDKLNWESKEICPCNHPPFFNFWQPIFFIALSIPWISFYIQTPTHPPPTYYLWSTDDFQPQFFVTGSSLLKKFQLCFVSKTILTIYAILFQSYSPAFGNLGTSLNQSCLKCKLCFYYYLQKNMKVLKLIQSSLACLASF
jgi:hypothetical protein